MLVMAISVLTMLADIAPAATVAAVPKPKKERLICRHEEATGTRMGGQSICKTQSQWDAESREAQDLLRSKMGGNLETVSPYAIPVTPPH